VALFISSLLGPVGFTKRYYSNNYYYTVCYTVDVKDKRPSIVSF